jgi:hypothetical protein
MATGSDFFCQLPHLYPLATLPLFLFFKLTELFPVTVSLNLFYSLWTSSSPPAPGSMAPETTVFSLQRSCLSGKVLNQPMCNGNSCILFLFHILTLSLYMCVCIYIYIYIYICVYIYVYIYIYIYMCIYIYIYTHTFFFLLFWLSNKELHAF